MHLGSAGAALSCATSSWCLATTADGVFRYTGSTWTQVGSSGGRVYSAVSCPAADSCIGASGRSLYRFDGTTWTGVFTFAHTVDDVSCASVGHCVAVSESGVEARLTGTTWTKLPAAPRGDADTDYYLRVVCPTDTRCLLSGPSVGGVAQLDGSTWKLTPHVVDGIVALACASATRCIAVSNDEDTNQQPFTSTATFDGTSWSAAKRFPDTYLAAADGTVDVAASSPTTWLVSAEGYVSESA